MSDETTCPLCKLPMVESGCSLTPDDPRGPFRCQTALGPPGTPELAKALCEAIERVPVAERSGWIWVGPWRDARGGPEEEIAGGSYVSWSDIDNKDEP